MNPIIILDTRTAIIKGPDKGRYHIKIKLSFPVIKNGEKKWIPKRAKTKVYATEKEFASIMGSPRSTELKLKRDILDNLYQKAKDIASIQGLTPKQYINLMESSGNFDNVIGLFKWKIDQMMKLERIGNASAIETAMNSFIRFKKSDFISFSEITVDWLNEYKRWMVQEEKNSVTTVYIYCRSLRHILKLAVDPFRKITEDSIPFGKGKFKIPASKKGNRKFKFNYSKDEIIQEKNKILAYKATNPKVNKALNYWKASFFGNGCNMADLLRWKRKDIHDNVIIFLRKKTENTEEQNEPITVYLSEPLLDIINIEGNKTLNPDDYIFPVLNDGMNAVEQRNAVKKFTKLTNEYLEVAAEDMGLKMKLTTGSARYLMSTILRRHGIELTAIRDILGHESTQTTEHYADGTDLDLLKLISKQLVV
jgi:integrase/recombinase XerD